MIPGEKTSDNYRGSESCGTCIYRINIGMIYGVCRYRMSPAKQEFFVRMSRTVSSFHKPDFVRMNRESRGFRVCGDSVCDRWAHYDRR